LSFFGFGDPPKIDILLENEASRPLHFLEGNPKGPQGYPIYTGNEPISGIVIVQCEDELSYENLRIEFIGEIEHAFERGRHSRFVHLEAFLGKHQGTLPAGKRQMNFSFPNAVKQQDSYHGYNVFLRYYLKFTCERSLASDFVQEKEIWVEHYTSSPEINSPLKMEVGIEDCLHLEFEYNQHRYHLNDAIVGKIYFLLIRIQLKYMELELIRREYSGLHTDAIVESERLAQFEVMDGSPVKGESIPVRLYLSPFSLKLTPTYNLPSMKFAVRYFLNIVLVDENERRYFKQSEVTLWRAFPEYQYF